MKIVSVVFQSTHNPEEYSTREYSYFAKIPLAVGDIVLAPVRTSHNTAKVIKLGVDPSEVGCDIRLLKTITSLAGTPAPDQMTLDTVGASTPAPTF